MSQYNITNAGPVLQDHGIIDYLQGSEPFMRLMNEWQRALQVCAISLTKENLEAIVSGEGEPYEEIVARFSWSIIDQYDFVVPLSLRAELREFMKAVSKEYRVWEFDKALSSDYREDEYTEGMCIIHGLYKEGASDTADSQVLAQYFADRVARGLAKAIEASYKTPLTFFMNRHPKDFKRGLMRVTFNDQNPFVKFQLALTMED